MDAFTLAQTDDYRGLEILLLAASILVAAIGFVISDWLNRRNNIHLKRLEYRMIALHAVLDFQKHSGSDAPPISRPEIRKMLGDTRRLVKLYCDPAERAHMEALVSAVERGAAAEVTAHHLQSLVKIAVWAIQDDLRIERVELP
ncbi:MAG: hypothetical protein ACK55O_13575 [Phycisphaerales bacterium]|jgi:hypothetical protein|nr:hypothetical protein [Phycisphaeraceae bacterium]